MKGFLFPILAGLACLPCVVPLLLILGVGVGALLATGLIASAVVVLLGAPLVIALTRRRATVCTPNPEDASGR
jgi:hypothetical protein